MRIDILTVMPEILEGPLNYSMIKRAQEKDLVEITVHDIRDFTTDKHRKVDDEAYGPDAGMVLSVQPIADAIEWLKSKNTYDEIIYMTPDGELFNQQKANYFSTLNNIIILCGHYKGIDQRLRDMYITREISVGDYVVTGGELPAAIMTDSIVRLIPGVLSDGTSALTDSFQDGLLAPPVYTRPYEYKGMKVPDILLSGNFKEIEKWQAEKSLEITRNRRPDLLDEEE